MNTPTLRNYTRTKPSKAYTEFKNLLPSDGFCVLKPTDFKKMMKIIQNEPDKNQKYVYFAMVLDKLFASGWGWFMRLGESLSAKPRYASPAQMPDNKRADGLAVLRMVKDMHIKLKYSPSYITLINMFIKDFGGHTLSKDEIKAQASNKLMKATIALKAGAKQPRKQKKMIKNVLKVKTR